MKNLFDLTGKVVAITGGAGNLGTAMTAALLDYGANVAAVGRDDRLGDDFLPWREKGKLAFIARDLAAPDGARQALADVVERFGGLDALVNNAAYSDGTLGVAFRCTRAAIPLLEERGGGAIVNIGSMYGLVAPDFTIYGDDIPWNPPNYGAGKAGLIQFTRYCAAALAPKKIRVNALTPGPFPNVTPQTDRSFIERLSGKTMMRRTGRAEEIAGALILLCSDASSFMTGSNIVVDSGMTSW